MNRQVLCFLLSAVCLVRGSALPESRAVAGFPAPDNRYLVRIDSYNNANSGVRRFGSGYFISTSYILTSAGQISGYDRHLLEYKTLRAISSIARMHPNFNRSTRQHDIGLIQWAYKTCKLTATFLDFIIAIS